MENKNLSNTKTLQNLINSFAGESQARNRYTYFASAAKKAGYEQIADIFLKTADNEKEHAKLFYKYLGSGKATVNGEYPYHLGTTLENLKHAAAGENLEWTQLYKNASIIAAEEGFSDISQTFKYVCNVEKHHEARFLALAKNIEEFTVFKKEGEVIWVCRNCGYIYKGQEAPQFCPNCFHPQAYFELLCDNF